MKVLELFSGTASVSNEFKKRGHETYTIDSNARLHPDLNCDIMSLDADDIVQLFGYPMVIWASPPCQGFSTGSISKHWYRSGRPKSEKANHGIVLVKKTLKLCEALNPAFWFLENPRAMLRSLRFMSNYQRVTVTYCQYGDTRQKPTDIWGNRNNDLKWIPPCKPRSSCHESAPRGSRKGTQGLKGAKERGVIPPELGKDLCIQIEKVLSGIKVNNQSYLEVGGLD